MATGILARGTLTNNVAQNIYSIPADAEGGYAVVKVQMMNMGISDANCRIALHGSSLTDADYLEYDVAVVPRGLIERSGVVVGAGQAITLWTTNSDSVTFTVHGTEVNVPDPVE